MKKDRACSMPSYPVYPMYGAMMPQMGMPNNIPMPIAANPNMPMMDNQLVTLNNKVENLETRVARLESLVGNNTNSKYTDSNYYMV